MTKKRKEIFLLTLASSIALITLYWGLYSLKGQGRGTVGTVDTVFSRGILIMTPLAVWAIQSWGKLNRKWVILVSVVSGVLLIVTRMISPSIGAILAFLMCVGSIFETLRRLNTQEELSKNQ